jgi:hypothetical protein
MTSAPIPWAASFAVTDPDVGAMKGRARGFFDGTLADPAAAPWLTKHIAMQVTPAIFDAAPKPSLAVLDKQAVAALINARIVQALTESAAVGVVVVEAIDVTTPAPAAARAHVAAPLPAFEPPRMRLPPAPVVSEIGDVDPLNVTASGAITVDPRTIMPFVAGKAVAPPSALGSTAGARAGATAAMPAFDDVGVLPFDDGTPRLTVEQYASLCVERALDPHHEGEIAKRYKILTEEALRSLDARWRRRFEAEGALQQRWQTAYAQYKAWIESQKP